MDAENNLVNSNIQNIPSSNIRMTKARHTSDYLESLVNKISKKLRNEEITTNARNISNMYKEGYIVNST